MDGSFEDQDSRSTPMGFFDRFVSSGRNPEPTYSESLWNPVGTDRLLNEDLHRAMEAVAKDPTAEHRRRLYEWLAKITYCVPSNNHDAGGLTISASRNERGEMVMVAFSDPCALKRWLPNPPEFLAVAAWKLFEIMLENGFAEIVINPAGPAGGKLSRSEVERLARGEIPL
jgi:hypothetical protein